MNYIAIGYWWLELDEELGWKLDADAQQRYAHAIAELADVDCADSRLRTIACNYHKDHVLVMALRNSQDPGYEQAWERVAGEVVVCVRKAGLAWSQDATVDVDDLVQTARTAVFRSIGSFRFVSKFSTWLHQVVVRSIQRSIRDRKAKKRDVQPESLENVDAPVQEEHHPEAIASARALLAEIKAILATHPDPRLVELFSLWTHDDLSMQQIGEKLHLHPSRVRALLAEARRFLQQHPNIRTWTADDDETSEPES